MIHNIDAHQLKKLLKESRVILIDVREQQEYDDFSIPDSHLVPLNEISINIINDINKDQRDIVFYCRAGVRSLIAAKKILENNPKVKLYNLKDGTIGWINMLAEQTKR